MAARKRAQEAEQKGSRKLKWMQESAHKEKGEDVRKVSPGPMLFAYSHSS